MQTDTQPGQELEQLEHQRDELIDRLTRVCRDPSPDSVEGVEFTGWKGASKAKGELTLLLLNAIDNKNAEIREIIAPDFSRSPRAALVMVAG